MKLVKTLCLSFCGLALLLSLSVCATTQNCSSYPYIGLAAGISIAKLGQHNIEPYPLIPGSYKEYRSNNSFSLTPLFGVNGGYAFSVSHDMDFALGLGLYSSLNHDAEGQIWSNTGGLNEHILDYAYKVNSTTLMVEGKLNRNLTGSLSAYIALGAGPSWNEAQSYQEKLITTVHPEHSFFDHMMCAFAYQAEIGASYSLTDKDRLSFAYRYADLGEAKFSNKDDPMHISSPFMLDVGSIQMHAILLNYTYLFK